MYATEKFRKSTLNVLESIVRDRSYKLDSKKLEGDGGSYNGGTAWFVEDVGKKEIFRVHEVFTEYRVGDTTKLQPQYSLSIGNESYFGQFPDSSLKALIDLCRTELAERARAKKQKEAAAEKQRKEDYATNFLQQYAAKSK